MISLALEKGETVVIEQRTAVATSRDLAPGTAEDRLTDAPWDDLLAEHAVVWAERWAKSDVCSSGDDAAPLSWRAALYHLLRAHVPGDNRVAIAAKGYAGDAYFGHFFWDTEMYLLPFFLYTQPALARSLVEFRVQGLRGARRYGYPGARIPREANGHGDNCCPNWQYADHEVHVTADVAYGQAHYGPSP